MLDTFSTSVEDYAKSLLASNTKEDAAYKPVVKAMLNYGAASQQYFGFMTYALANRSLTTYGVRQELLLAMDTNFTILTHASCEGRDLLHR